MYRQADECANEWIRICVIFCKKKKNLRYLTIFNIDVFSIILRLQRIIELLHGIFCKLKINVFYKIFYQIF